MIKANYLKSIRKQLNLKQNDITNGQITRNTISHIENQKISLTEKTINLILASINQHLKKSNHFIKLEYEDLFTEDRFKNKLIAEELFDELELLSNISNTNLNLLIEEINTLIAKWDFPIIKMRVYNLLGEYYYDNFDYNTSQYYYHQNVSSAYRIGSTDDIGQAILKLMRADIMTNSTSTSLELSRQLISRKSELELQTYLGLLFNSALLLEKKGQYVDAIVNLDEIEQLLENDQSEQLLDVLLLKALCQESLQQFNKAIEIYERLLVTMDYSGDFARKANIHCSMIALYIKQSNKKLVQENLNLVLDLLPSISQEDSYLPGIYLELAYCYRYFKQYDYAKKFFNKSIQSGIRINEFYDLAEALVNFIKINEFLQSPISRSTTLLILQLVSSKKIQSDDDVIFYYVSFLENNKAYEELSFFVNNMIRIRKESV